MRCNVNSIKIFKIYLWEWRMFKEATEKEDLQQQMEDLIKQLEELQADEEKAAGSYF